VAKETGFLLNLSVGTKYCLKKPGFSTPRVQDYSCLCYDILKKQILLRGESMPTLTLTDEQVIELAQKLPDRKKHELLKLLLMQPWESWAKLTHDGPEKARQAAAQRGKDWDGMTEDEREDFIDELLHED
jgi:hypothetical protein